MVESAFFERVEDAVRQQARADTKDGDQTLVAYVCRFDAMRAALRKLFYRHPQLPALSDKEYEMIRSLIGSILQQDRAMGEIQIDWVQSARASVVEMEKGRMQCMPEEPALLRGLADEIERLWALLRETIGIMKMWQRDPDSTGADLSPIIEKARSSYAPVPLLRERKPEEAMDKFSVRIQRGVPGSSACACLWCARIPEIEDLFMEQRRLEDLFRELMQSASQIERALGFVNATDGEIGV